MLKAIEKSRADRRDAAALLAVCALLTLLLGRVLAAPGFVAPGLPTGDARTQWVPWREFGYQSLRDGALPLWNPHVLCGTPFVGGWQSALFYPPNLLFWVAPAGAAAAWSVWVHWMLSAVGAYALARALRISRPGAALAALAFTLGAPQMLRVYAGHWGAVCALPWMPIVFLCVEKLLRTRRSEWALLGAGAVGMQFLAGAPQYVLFTAIAAAVYAVWAGLLDNQLTWKHCAGAAGWTVAAYVGGLLLAAVQVFPGLAASAFGARSVGMRTEWHTLFSWGPEGPLSLVLPRFFGGMNEDYWGRYNLWEMCAYIGVATLALALAGVGRRRRGWPLALTAGFMAALALGERAGLFGLLVELGGAFEGLRGPAKFLAPFSLMAALLAGYGLDRLARPSARKTRRVAAILAAALGVGLLLGAAAIARNANLWRGVYEPARAMVRPQSLAPDGAVDVAGAGRLASLEAARVGMTLLVLAVCLGAFRAGLSRFFRIAIVALAGMELAVFAWPYLGERAMFDSRAEAWPADVRAWLDTRPQPARALLWAEPNINDAARHAIDTPEGVEPNPPRGYHELFQAAVGRPADIAPSIYQAIPPMPIAAWTNTRYLVAPNEMEGGENPVFRGKTHSVYELPGVLPRCFVVPRAVRALSEAESLDLARTVDWRREVVLTTDAPEPDTPENAADAPAQPTFSRIGPNGIQVVVDAPWDGWLVILESYAPGWRGDAPVYRANHAFMAVPVQAGQQVVRLRYAPRSFTAGAWVSVLALFGLAGWLILLIAPRSRACRTGAKETKGP